MIFLCEVSSFKVKVVFKNTKSRCVLEFFVDVTEGGGGGGGGVFHSSRHAIKSII